MEKGKLFIVSGPSGVGKGTICKGLLGNRNDMVFSVSMTTREPREGEIEGVSYYFVSKEKFIETIENDGFLEYAEVFGNYYGTPRNEVEEKLKKGIDILLDIDVQGALQVKKKHPEGVGIFILPPSIAELKKRILGRGTESEESISLRLSKALKEMSYVEKYDYCVVNDYVDTVLKKVTTIVEAEHLKVSDDAILMVERFREEL